MERRHFISKMAMGAAALSILPTLDFGSLTFNQDDNKCVKNVLDYIKANWEKSFYYDKPGVATRWGVELPFPYSSPSMKGDGEFTFFFYWDTYFTNLGLLRNGHRVQAKNNIKNILWLIEEQGYMPNHVGIHNRSQSPYLQLMVRDFFANLDDPNTEADFFKQCAEGIRKEYQFWMTSRYSQTGLNHFGHHDDAKGCISFYNRTLIKRLKLDPNVSDEEKRIVGGHYMAEAENWDFNQRYNGRCMDFNAVDLNALLYGYEMFLHEAAIKLNWHFKDFYKERAGKRKGLMTELLWNKEKGWFFDYDFVNKRQSEVYAISGLQPMFMGLATDEQAKRILANLPLLERKYGVATTNEVAGCRDYQWAYPVVWPPMVYLTVKSLDQYGFKVDAKRIAEKYIDLHSKLFEKHGKLFEKTDAETGELSNADYDAEPMLGWTAGVFVALAEYVN
ncbi:MAG: alpha,alpha-trehalase [Bacteroidia bacterium]|jgi:alpha,alpha-trehalase